MSDSEEEIRLRDQFAIAAMQALITNLSLHKAYIEDDNENTESKGKMNRIAIIAYKVADEMRKARLKTFT